MAEVRECMKLRFTIRDLLWLTLVAALIVGWWVDRRSIQRQSAIEFNALRQTLIESQRVFVTTNTAAWPRATVPPAKPLP